jgi:hypothetical protein
MSITLFREGERPAKSGLSIDQLQPAIIWTLSDVALAQADSLSRLGHRKDHKLKLLWGMALAADCLEANPRSMLAILNVSRIARAARNFDLANRMIVAARSLQNDKEEKLEIDYEENSLIRERDIAAGNQVQMARNLIIYTCQRCGRLTEYISIPCMNCGWHPTTLLEISHSGRLSTTFFCLWDLLDIGRQIDAGHRKPTEIVSNLAEVAKSAMADPNFWYRQYVEDALKAVREKGGDFFSYFEVSKCRSCGTHLQLQDAKHCANCKTKSQMPPPLRLLICLRRLSVHFQHNFNGPKSIDFELFIRYLVSLQSKLFREQETPSDQERDQVFDAMRKLEMFDVGNGLGNIIMREPTKIVYRISTGLPEERKRFAETVLIDFTKALQFLANWMLRTKALS